MAETDLKIIQKIWKHSPATAMRPAVCAQWPAKTPVGYFFSVVCGI